MKIHRLFHRHTAQKRERRVGTLQSFYEPNLMFALLASFKDDTEHGRQQPKSQLCACVFTQVRAAPFGGNRPRSCQLNLIHLTSTLLKSSLDHYMGSVVL